MERARRPGWGKRSFREERLKSLRERQQIQTAIQDSEQQNQKPISTETTAEKRRIQRRQTRNTHPRIATIRAQQLPQSPRFDNNKNNNSTKKQQQFRRRQTRNEHPRVATIREQRLPASPNAKNLEDGDDEFENEEENSNKRRRRQTRNEHPRVATIREQRLPASPNAKNLEDEEDEFENEEENSNKRRRRQTRNEHPRVATIREQRLPASPSILEMTQRRSIALRTQERNKGKQKRKTIEQQQKKEQQQRNWKNERGGDGRRRKTRFANVRSNVIEQTPGLLIDSDIENLRNLETEEEEEEEEELFEEQQEKSISEPEIEQSEEEVFEEIEMPESPTLDYSVRKSTSSSSSKEFTPPSFERMSVGLGRSFATPTARFLLPPLPTIPNTLTTTSPSKRNSTTSVSDISVMLHPISDDEAEKEKDADRALTPRKLPRSSLSSAQIIQEESEESDQNEPEEEEEDSEQENDEKGEEEEEEEGKEEGTNKSVLLTPRRMTRNALETAAAIPPTPISLLRNTRSSISLSQEQQFQQLAFKQQKQQLRRKQQSINGMIAKPRHVVPAHLRQTFLRSLSKGVTDMSLESDAIPALARCCEGMLDNIASKLDGFARKDGRKIIEFVDVENFLHQSGVLAKQKSLSDLMRRELSIESIEHIIPIARAHNIVLPSP